MVLIDTSAWIDYFRNANKLVQSYLDNDEVCTTDIIIMEFLQGIRDDKSYKELKEWFLMLPNLKLTQTELLSATEIYRNCRKQGLTVRKSIDCIIAAVAIANNVTLIGIDSDFELIAKVCRLNYISAKE